MKKFIILTLIIFVLFFAPMIAYGQNIADNVPGLTCGIAADATGKDKCCNFPKVVNCEGNQIVSNIANFATKLAAIIPGTGFLSDIFNNSLDQCKKMQAYIDNNVNPEACMSGNPTIGGQVTTDFSNPSCKCTDLNISNPNLAMIEMCSKYLPYSSSVSELKNCLNCANGNGMWTGMGCLSLDINTLITNFVLSTGIGLGGGFSLLCIIYAAFMMQSSQGNPEKLKKAQEMITSCIMGLMLIIFSVFIMKLIGVNILRIPGFG